MNIDTSIFKAYDVRGIYPSQINAEVVHRIAQAYTHILKPKTIVIGHDMRLSGEEFSAAAVKGFTEMGVHVVDIGLVSTDQLYYAAANLEVDGGIQITASHNPKEYGGLKMVREKGRPISGDSGIYEIRDMVISVRQLADEISEAKGTVTQQDISKGYFEHLLSKFDVASMKPLKIVANANFGMANPAIEFLKTALPVEFVSVLNDHLDGNFPKGRPDPLVSENRDETIAEIKRTGADLGVAWDADADRCFFFDEHGQFVTPAYASSLFAKYYLEKNPGSKILHDTRVVRVIDDTVTNHGGVVIMNKAGHSFIKERMIAEEIVFGCETSGHYYFKDTFYLDNGLMPLLVMLDILSKGSESFSEILQPLRDKYFISEEVNLNVADPKMVMDMLKQKYSDANIDAIDGYDFNYPDWRFNVRSSNTEALLRVNMEASNLELLNGKLEEVVSEINKI